VLQYGAQDFGMQEPFPEVLASVQDAPSAPAVIESLQRYLASLSDLQRADLPWGLPAQLDTPAQVALWASHMRNARDATPSPTYGRLSKLLSEAATRLASLAATDSHEKKATQVPG
jgi:hypothetical protein